jgi:hypothetical protein
LVITIESFKADQRAAPTAERVSIAPINQWQDTITRVADRLAEPTELSLLTQKG